MYVNGHEFIWLCMRKKKVKMYRPLPPAEKVEPCSTFSADARGPYMFFF